MIISHKKRSYKAFILFGGLGGILYLVISSILIYEAIVSGADTDMWCVSIFIFLIGIALLVGAIYIHEICRNHNAGKMDKSICVTYNIISGETTRTLDSIDSLINELKALVPNKEIVIQLSTEYFGLTEWRFFKKGNWYFSFVYIYKKDKIIQYFIMPRTKIEEALQPFREVFEQQKAVNTKNLINMNKYQCVLEFYKLN